MPLLIQLVVLLGAAVIMVPLFRRLRLGAVLGYLAAGVLVGPWGLALVAPVEGVSHLGEFGVVLLFFVIGLELHPKRLWLMRRDIFGLGGGQMLLTMLPLGAAAWWSGMSPTVAVLVGIALAFSSTAFALQLLAEQGQLNTRHGRSAFAVLLFQDLAVIPLLVVAPVLAGGEAMPGWREILLTAGRSAGLVALIVVLGRYLLRYALRIVAGAGVTEVFTAMSLLTVAVTAMISEAAGLSMAMGGFMAGVLLADSEYRHALEGDLNPFKGLLLGLFFMSVGMSVNLGLFVHEAGLILALSTGLMLLKAGILMALLRFAGIEHAGAASGAAALSQGGEFAFVLLGAIAGTGLLGRERLELIVAVVIVSMALTPLLSAMVSRALRANASRAERDYDRPDEDEPRVIIAGFGRFGQIVARILRARGIPFTALELNPDQVDLAKRFGSKVHYGDPTRVELLRAAHADRAKVFVLALDDVDASLRSARVLRENFPKLTIFARARNRAHAYQLMELGITRIYREMYFSSLEITRGVLNELGYPETQTNRMIRQFQEQDEKQLYAGFGRHHDLEKLIEISRETSRELETLLREDLPGEKD